MQAVVWTFLDKGEPAVTADASPALSIVEWRGTNRQSRWPELGAATKHGLEEDDLITWEDAAWQ